MSRPEYCPDCGRDRLPDESEIVSFTPDAGWAAEFARRLADDEPTVPGDARVTVSPSGARWLMWSEPVIGWAVVRRHYAGSIDTGHENRIEAVLLCEDAFTDLISDYRDNLYPPGKGFVDWRLVRRDGAP